MNSQTEEMNNQSQNEVVKMDAQEGDDWVPAQRNKEDDENQDSETTNKRMDLGVDPPTSNEQPPSSKMHRQNNNPDQLSHENELDPSQDTLPNETPQFPRTHVLISSDSESFISGAYLSGYSDSSFTQLRSPNFMSPLPALWFPSPSSSRSESILDVSRADEQDIEMKSNDTQDGRCSSIFMSPSQHSTPAPQTSSVTPNMKNMSFARKLLKNNNGEKSPAPVGSSEDTGASPFQLPSALLGSVPVNKTQNRFTFTYTSSGSTGRQLVSSFDAAAPGGARHRRQTDGSLGSAFAANLFSACCSPLQLNPVGSTATTERKENTVDDEDDDGGVPSCSSCRMEYQPNFSTNISPCAIEVPAIPATPSRSSSINSQSSNSSSSSLHKSQSSAFDQVQQPQQNADISDSEAVDERKENECQTLSHLPHCDTAVAPTIQDSLASTNARESLATTSSHNLPDSAQLTEKQYLSLLKSKYVVVDKSTKAKNGRHYFYCSLCKKTMSSDINRHLNDVHFSGKRFYCWVCFHWVAQRNNISYQHEKCEYDARKHKCEKTGCFFRGFTQEEVQAHICAKESFLVVTSQCAVEFISAEEFAKDSQKYTYQPRPPLQERHANRPSEATSSSIKKTESNKKKQPSTVQSPSSAATRPRLNRKRSSAEILPQFPTSNSKPPSIEIADTQPHVPPASDQNEPSVSSNPHLNLDLNLSSSKNLTALPSSSNKKKVSNKKKQPSVVNSPTNAAAAHKSPRLNCKQSSAKTLPPPSAEGSDNQAHVPQTNGQNELPSDASPNVDLISSLSTLSSSRSKNFITVPIVPTGGNANSSSQSPIGVGATPVDNSIGPSPYQGGGRSESMMELPSLESPKVDELRDELPMTERENMFGAPIESELCSHSSHDSESKSDQSTN